MEYISTRNQVPSVPFSLAVEHGLAPDGGLYIPKELPNLKPHLKAWSVLDYPDLCKAFFSLRYTSLHFASLRFTFFWSSNFFFFGFCFCINLVFFDELI